MYYVQKPVFEAAADRKYHVHFENLQKLQAQTAAEALKEAKRLGYRVPIVGWVEEEGQ